MKSWLIFALMTFSLSVFAEEAKRADGVQILSFLGNPQLLRKVEDSAATETVKLTKGERLKGSFSLRTDSDSTVDAEVLPGKILKLFPKSEIEFPLVRWENGELDQIRLLKGRIRWEAKENSGLTLRTDLSEVKLNAGVYGFDYEPEVPQIKVCTLQGQMEFSELNGEESVLLKDGQKSTFQGRKEADGDIIYDVLLKGKKIPKGVKSKPEPVTEQDLKDFSLIVEKKIEVKAIKKKVEAPKVVKPKRPNEICKSPGGLFNECSWICVNKDPKKKSLIKKCNLDSPQYECVRFRCNANGEWSDPTQLERQMGKKICGVEAVVSACDY